MSEGQVEIAIDAMGGENSPYKVLKGVEIFLKKEKNTKIIFFGDEPTINQNIKKNNLNIFNYEVINTYDINELQSLDKGTHIDIIQKSSNKIQLRGLTLGHVTVNGQQAGTNIQTMNDTVNAAFNMSLTQFQDFIKSDVFDYTEDDTFPAIVETNEQLADGVNYNSTYMELGLPDGDALDILPKLQKISFA